MKKTILLLLFAACCLQTSAQLYWKWAYTSANNKPNAGNIGATTAIDDAGNVYVAGCVSDTCTINNVPITPRPIGDMLIMKYNKAGVLQWAKAPRGTYNGAVIQSIAPANNGDIYIAGWATTPGYFDTIVSGEPGIEDESFLARMDADGNYKWIKTCEGVSGWSHLVKSRQLTVDADNNVYFSGTVKPGNARYFDTTITSATGGVIMVKLDADGNVKWRHIIYGNNINGGSISSPVMKISDRKELWYATTIPHKDTQNLNLVYCNLGIGILDSNGHRIWHKEYGDTLLANWIFNLGGFDMDLDGQGNMYVMGSYNRAFQIQSGPSSGNNSSVFITKFNAVGVPAWSKFITGPYSESVSGIKYNQQKHQLICTGNHTGSISLGNQTLTTGNNSAAIFVAAYDTSGTVNWVASYANTGKINSSYATAINNQQKMFAITGRFEDSVYFGNYGIYTNSINNHKDFYIAVASLDSSKGWATDILNQLTGINFKMFPNPASSYVTIQTEDFYEDAELLILNTLGQQVYSAPVQFTSSSINLERLSNGHYLVVLKRGSDLLARPLIVTD